MSSILDLVNEYYQLERQKTASGGILDQASETRYQCLRFFLEFDFTEPFNSAAVRAASHTEYQSPEETSNYGEQVPDANQEPAPEPDPAPAPGEGDEEVIQLDAPMEDQPAAPAAAQTVDSGLHGTRETIRYSEEAVVKAMNEYLSREKQTSDDKPLSDYAVTVPPSPAAELPPLETAVEPPPPIPQELPLVEPDAIMTEPPRPAGPVKIIVEPRRVTVHFSDGDVKRGIVKEFSSDSESLTLFNNEQTASESIAFSSLKVIFVMTQPGHQAAEPPAGRPITVTFKDGRSLRGSSPDYAPGAVVFTLHPEPRQGNIEKIAVFREATDEIR